jgi:hypothetical protein
VKKSLVRQTSTSDDVNVFLQQTQNLRTMINHGERPARLAFIIDGTASRQPTWNQACQIQTEMFKAVEAVGKLQVQLVYFRGVAEFQASEWFSDSGSLLREMTSVQCLAGHTQIERALKNLLEETRRQPVAAAVYIGDACEESSAEIFRLAGQLRLHKTPVFMFQENLDQRAAEIYENVAKLSGGAYCRFDSSSASMLTELLSAVAVYAAGGGHAFTELTRNSTPLLQNLARQLLR